MIQRKYGHVVALSSIAGIFGQSNIVPYCATKFAVRGKTDVHIITFFFNILRYYFLLMMIF